MVYTILIKQCKGIKLFHIHLVYEIRTLFKNY